MYYYVLWCQHSKTAGGSSAGGWRRHISAGEQISTQHTCHFAFYLSTSSVCWRFLFPFHKTKNKNPAKFLMDEQKVFFVENLKFKKKNLEKNVSVATSQTQLGDFRTSTWDQSSSFRLMFIPVSVLTVGWCWWFLLKSVCMITVLVVFVLLFLFCSFRRILSRR